MIKMMIWATGSWLLSIESDIKLMPRENFLIIDIEPLIRLLKLAVRKFDEAYAKFLIW